MYMYIYTHICVNDVTIALELALVKGQEGNVVCICVYMCIYIFLYIYICR